MFLKHPACDIFVTAAQTKTRKTDCEPRVKPRLCGAVFNTNSIPEDNEKHLQYAGKGILWFIVSDMFSSEKL